MPKERTPRFDVFLSYNSKDKLLVTQLKTRLSVHGLRAWLDQDELQPGASWQHLLETGIRASKSVVILVGKDGLGPWEKEEMQAALVLAVKSKKPVIPVRLACGTRRPKLPIFLRNRAFVEIGDEFTEESVQKIVWGITGKKVKALKKTQPLSLRSEKNSANISGRRIRCTLSCLERSSDVLHSRNGAFIASLCNRFPRTQFLIFKDVDPEESFNPKELMQLLFGCFRNGETVTLEVSGELEALAAMVFKTAWENLGGYSDNPIAIKDRITTLTDLACARLYDPDLEDVEGNIPAFAKSEPTSTDKEFRTIAVINDRLHDISLPMIPYVAKHFHCELQISFEIHELGVYSFEMGQKNNYDLDKRILDLDIGVGTRITILTSGANAGRAGLAIKNVLQSLWQCDQWLRRRGKHFDPISSAMHLVEFAREMAKHQIGDYSYVQSPFVSNLITSKQVFINARGAILSKEAVLHQLCAPHADLHDLDIADLLQRVKDGEARQTVVPRQGFAVAHAAMSYGPRISITFGVYPDGIQWSPYDAEVKLVAMAIYAPDTIRTWRDCMKRFAVLFKSRLTLQNDLIAVENSEAFTKKLREAEVSLVKI